MRVNACSRQGEGECGGEGTRRIAHPFESTARLCCGPAEIWTIFRSFGFFTGRSKKGQTALLLRIEKRDRHTRFVFRVEHSPSTRDDVLTRAAIANLTAFTTAHAGPVAPVRNGPKAVLKATDVPFPLAVSTIENVAMQPAWMTLSPSSIQAPTIFLNGAISGQADRPHYTRQQISTFYPFCSKKIASRLTCPLEFNVALKRPHCWQPGWYGHIRGEPDAGRAPKVLRADLQRAVLPEGTDGLQTERGGCSAVPEVENAVDVD